MNKKQFNLLGRVFAAEITHDIYQTSRKSVIAALEELEKSGHVVKGELKLGGRFPVTCRGWNLTAKGHIEYCQNCKA